MENSLFNTLTLLYKQLESLEATLDQPGNDKKYASQLNEIDKLFFQHNLSQDDYKHEVELRAYTLEEKKHQELLAHQERLLEEKNAEEKAHQEAQLNELFSSDGPSSHRKPQSQVAVEKSETHKTCKLDDIFSENKLSQPQTDDGALDAFFS